MNPSCLDNQLRKFYPKISFHFGEFAICKSDQIMTIYWPILITVCNSKFHLNFNKFLFVINFLDPMDPTKLMII